MYATCTLVRAAVRALVRKLVRIVPPAAAVHIIPPRGSSELSSGTFTTVALGVEETSDDHLTIPPACCNYRSMEEVLRSSSIRDRFQDKAQNMRMQQLTYGQSPSLRIVECSLPRSRLFRYLLNAHKRSSPSYFGDRSSPSLPQRCITLPWTTLTITVTSTLISSFASQSSVEKEQARRRSLKRSLVYRR